ncbi:MAG: hypothetical protein EB078_08550 [Proteobacteria bacterium]|jgi:hypothetical protein|nr:hypothetical protein [Pseudomonadota bacterium]NDD04942.1 hypothetical protein [Pseudomonadota bacterium]
MSFIISMLSDGTNGTVSSKRVVTLLAFLMCAYGFVAMINGYHVDPKIYDSMMYIVLAGLGFTASEKFTKKEEK